MDWSKAYPGRLHRTAVVEVGGVPFEVELSMSSVGDDWEILSIYFAAKAGNLAELLENEAPSLMERIEDQVWENFHEIRDTGFVEEM